MEQVRYGTMGWICYDPQTGDGYFLLGHDPDKVKERYENRQARTVDDKIFEYAYHAWKERNGRT